MASMRQIRSRIRTAKNIQQITKAMKMVAAARLKRAQDRVQAARPYSEKMREAMASLGRAVGGSVTHPLLEVREPVRIGVLTITADRGLCGSYATNILKKSSEVLKPYDPSITRVLVVGRKGHNFFRRRPYPVVAEYDMNMTGASFAEAQAIGRKVRELYVSGEVDAVYLVYTKFLSALTQRPVSIPLLPIAPETDDIEPGIGGEDYLFEPDAESILGRVLPRYVDVLIYQAMLEAVASEHGSRMTAMSSATDNAGKMISGLTLSLNRARQANITKEIAEIVGGAEAIKS
ncbi:MAG: ATP synthase F1 subunit gamma [Capsulimonadales bacterium]|nr:ATP synthase F1 subunit gamma [Capsulimonadales bacterium]